MSEDRLTVCTHCARTNRVPQTRDAREAKCGSCGERLFSGHAGDVDGHNFERQITRSSIPVLVDIWAPWCGPCRAMAPAYEAAAKELEPDVRLIKLNSDAEQLIASRLGIRGIPTMLLYHHGKEVGRISGAMNKDQIVSWLKQTLSQAAV